MASADHNYDPFALIYNRYWGPKYAEYALETLNLLIPPLPRGARVLDLCCGSGQTTARLVDNGFVVTGIDNSSSLLSLARSNAPGAAFEFADAQSFNIRAQFDLVISLNDSLNHLVNDEELAAAFRCVANSLVTGGCFLFDLNLKHKYATSWAASMSFIESDLVCAIVSASDLERKLATFNAAVFTKTRGSWSRQDAHLRQTWYEPESVKSTLRRCGFDDIRVTDRKGKALKDNADKAFFTCSKK